MLDQTSEACEGIILPSHKWQPFFLKVMDDFIKFHKLPQDLKRPSGDMRIHIAMSHILEAMVLTMGEEKRQEILKELEKYKNETYN